MSRKRRSRHKGGSGKAHVRAGQRHDSPHSNPSQVFASMDAIASHLRGNGRLAVVFSLSAAGRIDDDCLILHGGQPLRIVPVWLLPAVVDKLPSLDTPELRQSIAAYRAEQAGMGGRA